MPFNVPEAELEITFVRSSGPGGQNVNKVNSKATVRWSVASSPSLSPEQRALLLARLAGRLTREGELIVVSQRFRDAPRNADDARAKLAELVSAALHRPRTRRPTRPTRGSQRRRREDKLRHSARKRDRRFRDAD